MTTIRTHRDLIAWQRAMKLAREVYRDTENAEQRTVWTYESNEKSSSTRSRPILRRVMRDRARRTISSTFESRAALWQNCPPNASSRSN